MTWQHPCASFEVRGRILQLFQLSGRAAQHKLKQGDHWMFVFGLLFQLERLKRESKSKKTSAKQIKDGRFPVSEVKVTTTVTTKGKNAGPIKVKPGEKSRKNLQLLRDMQTIQTSLQKDDISWDYWRCCRRCSWTIPVKHAHILDIKQLPFTPQERGYSMLGALSKYGPFILHPWVWLYALWSSLKHIPFLRYQATEPNCRSLPALRCGSSSPSVFSQHTKHRTLLRLGACEMSVLFHAAVELCVGGRSRCVLLENGTVARSPKGCRQFCSLRSCGDSGCLRENR